jgi:hypothetical protein
MRFRTVLRAIDAMNNPMRNCEIPPRFADGHAARVEVADVAFETDHRIYILGKAWVMSLDEARRTFNNAVLFCCLIDRSACRRTTNRYQDYNGRPER